MSKFLKIPYGNYTIEVQENGEIRLDTGENQGIVRITGDLIVEGSTKTTIQSTDTEISDNIITLNSGEPGFGISNRSSGLEIDRGGYRNAFLVFDEDVTYRDPDVDDYRSGTFVFKVEAGVGVDSTYEDEKLVGIKTKSIGTNNTDLILLGEGSYVVSVSGTTDYELNVTNDDDIPNKKYVDDLITSLLGSGNFIQSFDTKVQTYDFDETGIASNVDFQIDGVSVANMESNEFSIYDLRLTGNKLEAVIPDSNLILSVSGNGSIEIDKVMSIKKSITDPSTPSEGVKIYSKTPGPGDTGVYYKNEDGTQDELVSRNRALLYSMVI